MAVLGATLNTEVYDGAPLGTLLNTKVLSGGGTLGDYASGSTLPALGAGPTVQWVDEFNHSITSPTYYSTLWGTPTAVTSPIVDSDHPNSLKISSLNGTNQGVRKLITGSPTKGWTGFWYRPDFLPTISDVLIVQVVDATGAQARVVLGQNGTAYAYILGGGNSVSAPGTLVVDEWYWIEVIFDVNAAGGTKKLYWRINGVDMNTPTFTAVASTITHIQLFSGTADGTMDWYAASWRGGSVAAVTDWLGEPSSAPPVSTTGVLKYTPPGYAGVGDPTLSSSYPGYTFIDANVPNGSTIRHNYSNARIHLTLNDNTDYFVKMPATPVTWNSSIHLSGDRSCGLQIQGGRNVVIIGGSLIGTQNSDNDDQAAMIISAGNVVGVVHLEGLYGFSANGITRVTARTTVIQNCHIVVRDTGDRNATSGIHPDIIQDWGGGGEIKMHRFTGYSNYTGLVALLPTNPSKWTRYDVDIHALPPIPGGPLDSGYQLIMGNLVYLGDQKITEYIGDNLWVETGWHSSGWRRKLDDVISYGQSSPSYELYPGPGLSGTKYTSADPPTGGSTTGTTPVDLGRRQGDRLTHERVALLDTETWRWGVPTVAEGAVNGEFVPEASVGVGYSSPGYATSVLTYTPPGYNGVGDPTLSSSFPGYTIIDVPDNGSTRYYNLNDGIDYFINVGNYRFAERLEFVGGRNVVIIGGSIEIHDSPRDPTVGDRVGLMLHPRGGSVHYVEGLHIWGAGLHDAILVGALTATSASRVYIQNCRLGPVAILSGEVETQGHPDVIQVGSNMPGQIYLDKVTGLTNYTGFMFSDFTVGKFSAKRTNLRAVKPSYVNQTYSYWTSFYQGLRVAVIEFLDDVWSFNDPTQGSGPWLNHFYPYTQSSGGRTFSSQPTDYAIVATDAISEYATWTAISNITGKFRNGLPPGGDFVPVGSVGAGYSSPGYA